MVALAILVLVILFPLAHMLLSGTSRQLKHNSTYSSNLSVRVQQRSGLANVIGQMKSDYYLDHMDPYLSATPQQWGCERSTAAKSVFFYYGGPAYYSWTDTWAMRVVMQGTRALFAFRNDMFRFGLVADGGLAIDNNSPLNGVPFSGGAYVRGVLDVRFAQWDVSGGPLVVTGNAFGGPQFQLLSGTTFYYGGTWTPGASVVSGVAYSSVPYMDVLPIDLSRFETLHRTLSVGNSTWTFQDVAGECRCVYGPGPSDYYPATYLDYMGWPVFVVKDGNLRVSGRCGTRATLISYSAAPSATQGNVEIVDDLGQSAGTTVSSSTRAFAVLASGKITFDKGGGQDVYGYYDANTIAVASNGGGTATTVTVHGVVHVRNSIDSVSALGNSLQIDFDPGLWYNLPPGIPEKPLMVNAYLKQ
jgi:archaellum component FlaG (FlaF/FlaG flagellin family)